MINPQKQTKQPNHSKQLSNPGLMSATEGTPKYLWNVVELTMNSFVNILRVGK